MPIFDLFGVQKESAVGGDTQRLKDGPALSKKTWGALLLLDGVFILLCAGGLAARVSRGLKAPPTGPVLSKPAAVKDTSAKAEVNAPQTKTEDQVKKPEPAPKASAPAEAKAPAAKPPAAAEMKASAAKAASAPAPAKAEGVSRPVEFTHEDPSAKEVNLLGPFLVRTNGSKPMFKDAKGVWRLTIYLKSGETYKYRFEAVDAHGKRKLTEKRPMEVSP